MRERDADWESAHLIGWELCGGERHRLGEGALESGNGVEEGGTDWERAHLIGREIWRREMPTGRERT